MTQAWRRHEGLVVDEEGTAAPDDYTDSRAAVRKRLIVRVDEANVP